MTDTRADLANVLRRITKTYLGKDRPWRLHWGWRFANAQFGLIVFSAVLFSTQLARLTDSLEATVRDVRSRQDDLAEQVQSATQQCSRAALLLGSMEGPFPDELDAGREALDAGREALQAGSETRNALARSGFARNTATAVFVDLGYSFVLSGYIPGVLVLAGIIAAGIRNGGPLRLFFLGVTVPGVVSFVIRNALGLSAQMP